MPPAFNADQFWGAGLATRQEHSTTASLQHTIDINHREGGRADVTAEGVIVRHPHGAVLLVDPCTAATCTLRKVAFNPDPVDSATSAYARSVVHSTGVHAHSVFSLTSYGCTPPVVAYAKLDTANGTFLLHNARCTQFQRDHGRHHFVLHCVCKSNPSIRFTAHWFTRANRGTQFGATVHCASGLHACLALTFSACSGRILLIPPEPRPDSASGDDILQMTRSPATGGLLAQASNSMDWLHMAFVFLMRGMVSDTEFDLAVNDHEYMN